MRSIPAPPNHLPTRLHWLRLPERFATVASAQPLSWAASMWSRHCHQPVQQKLLIPADQHIQKLRGDWALERLHDPDGIKYHIDVQRCRHEQVYVHNVARLHLTLDLSLNAGPSTKRSLYTPTLQE